MRAEVERHGLTAPVCHRGVVDRRGRAGGHDGSPGGRGETVGGRPGARRGDRHRHRERVGDVQRRRQRHDRRVRARGGGSEAHEARGVARGGGGEAKTTVRVPSLSVHGRPPEVLGERLEAQRIAPPLVNESVPVVGSARASTVRRRAPTHARIPDERPREPQPRSRGDRDDRVRRTRSDRRRRSGGMAVGRMAVASTLRFEAKLQRRERGVVEREVGSEEKLGPRGGPRRGAGRLVGDAPHLRDDARAQSATARVVVPHGRARSSVSRERARRRTVQRDGRRRILGAGELHHHCANGRARGRGRRLDEGRGVGGDATRVPRRRARDDVREVKESLRPRGDRP